MPSTSMLEIPLMLHESTVKTLADSAVGKMDSLVKACEKSMSQS